MRCDSDGEQGVGNFHRLFSTYMAKDVANGNARHCSIADSKSVVKQAREDDIAGLNWCESTMPVSKEDLKAVSNRTD